MKKKKLLSIVLSAAMVFSMSAVGAFAAENDATVLSDATLIGAAPFEDATNVAPGSQNAPQPIRVALSEGADTVAANIDDYIQVKATETGAKVTVTASTDGDIVVMTPSAPLANNTKYTVDFDATNLPKIDDYDFTTSRGGSGGGDGSGSGGGQGGNQALTLTGQIPSNGATVASGQNLYAVFSNSLKSSDDSSLETDNEAQVSVVDTTTNQTVTSCTVDIIDNWTVKITTSGLVSGRTYNLNIGTLTANSTQTYTGTPIPFVAA